MTTNRLLTMVNGQRQLVTVPLAFDYDQAAIPTGAIATGATWRQRNSSNVPILEYVYDGNFWRIAGGIDSKQRLLFPAAGFPTVSGAVTSAAFNTLARRVSCPLSSTGTVKTLFNTYVSGFASFLGSPGQNFPIDFSKPTEIYTRIAAWNSGGLLRFYVCRNASIAATADLSQHGFGFLLDTGTRNLTLQLHTGSALFAQSGGQVPLLGSNYYLDFEMCWDGVSKFAIYVNKVFVGLITQSITGSFAPYVVHFAYDQSTPATIAQFLDQFVIQTVGGC